MVMLSWMVVGEFEHALAHFWIHLEGVYFGTRAKSIECCLPYHRCDGPYFQGCKLAMVASYQLKAGGRSRLGLARRVGLSVHQARATQFPTSRFVSVNSVAKTENQRKHS